MTLILPAGAEARSSTENLKQRIDTLGEEGREDRALAFDLLGMELTLEGVLELEGRVDRSDSDGNASELDYSADVEFAVAVNDYLSGSVVLVHEEDDGEAVDLDEAVVTLESGERASPYTLSLEAGKLYLPFGEVESTFVSGPFVEDLGETRSVAVVGGVEVEWFSLEVGCFAGTVDNHGTDDRVDSIVAALTFEPLENVSFGLSFLSDLAETNAGLVGDADFYTNTVPGVSAFVILQAGAVRINAEYASAIEDFEEQVVEGGEDLSGRKPSAWALEISWFSTDEWGFGARVEGADDYVDDPLRFGVTASVGLLSNSIVAVEYLRTENDVDTLDTVTVQFAVTF